MPLVVLSGCHAVSLSCLLLFLSALNIVTNSISGPQYVYFRMGVKQGEMVKSKLFRFSLEEVRHRHCFLERRGLYQTPDKNGQTTIINPKLDSILNASEDTFLMQVAKASAEEYDVFKRLVAREWKEEEQQLGSIEAEHDEEEEEDEDEEEDEETGGRDGYRKRMKKRLK